MNTVLQQGLTYDDVTIKTRWSSIKSRVTDCDLSTSLTKKYKLKLPIIASPMRTVCGREMALEMARLGALGIIHRFMPIESQKAIVDEIKETYPTAVTCAAVGITGNYLERALEVNADVLMIDTAHAESDRTLTVLKALKAHPKIKSDVIVGTIASSLAVMILQDNGADGLRVGIGTGSLCETRVRTGVGVPAITSLLDCVQFAKVPLYADGGIQSPGDVAKALSIGTSENGVTGVVLGSLLAATKESPGLVIQSGYFPNERLYKEYFGEASAKAQEGKENPRVEGNFKQIPYKGKALRIVTAICNGVRSSMSYVDARNLSEFRARAEFIQVSPASAREAKPFLLFQ